MALIYFYDVSETDKQQLTAGLQSSDHRWEYVPEQISLENINSDAEVISVFVSSRVTAEMIERMPNLRLIACRSTGFNNIDLAAAEARGITVTNVPTYGERTVAEFAFTLLLALSRKLRESNQATITEVEPDKLTGFDLFGRTLGVVGTGHIGQCAIEIAKGFGMHVIAYDAFPKNELAEKLGFEYRTLEEVMSGADVVTLHAPYLPSTHHIIDEHLLSIMKPSALLINTARGELVDTRALVNALEDKKLAGAGLDVLEGEKLMQLEEETALLKRHLIPAASLEQSVELLALMRMPQVLLTSHNAFNTIEAVGRINDTTVKNILGYWYGDVPNKIKPTTTMGKLIIARHGESEWNKTGLWTGSRDVHLTEKGFHDAALMGVLIKDIDIQQGFISEQVRTLETIQGMIGVMQQIEVPIERSDALNERDYGDYTGKNKYDMKDSIGEEAYNHIRRDWNCPIPNGESLKMVYDRAVPYYLEHIVPSLLAGKNVLLVSHGNAIRALLKYIETVGDDDIAGVEMIFGTALIYNVDKDGKMIKKETRKIKSIQPPAIQ